MSNDSLRRLDLCHGYLLLSCYTFIITMSLGMTRQLSQPTIIDLIDLEYSNRDMIAGSLKF